MILKDTTEKSDDVCPYKFLIIDSRRFVYFDITSKLPLSIYILKRTLSNEERQKIFEKVTKIPFKISNIYVDHYGSIALIPKFQAMTEMELESILERLKVKDIMTPIMKNDIKGFIKNIFTKKPVPTKPVENFVYETVLLNQDEPRSSVLLSLDHNGPNIYLDRDLVLIGREAKDVDYEIKSNAIGRIHASIQFQGSRFYIQDYNSVNGTFINGNRIVGWAQKEIKHHDVIRFAQYEYKVDINKI